MKFISFETEPCGSLMAAVSIPHPVPFNETVPSCDACTWRYPVWQHGRSIKGFEEKCYVHTRECSLVTNAGVCVVHVISRTYDLVLSLILAKHK
jgi:hypothetical protein